jgi:CBS domain-containing protein
MVAVLAIAGFLALVITIVVLRTRVHGIPEIKSSDIVVALVPIALWLFLTGEIQEFGFGELHIARAIKDASQKPVGPQVTEELPVEEIRVDAKEGVGAINELIRRKSQGLSFRLGSGRYNGGAIREYLDKLTSLPFLRYVILTHPDGRLFGFADARQLAALMRAGQGLDVDTFARSLNVGDEARLRELPGFTPAEKALHKDTDRSAALQQMNELDVQALPVVDDSGRFMGVVDRSKVSAGMLIDIAAKVGAES